MSMDLNRATFIGNVGQDPEIRVLPSGMAVANFSLATNKRIKDGAGGYYERTEWHNLVALDRRAEVVREYVHKGTRIYVEGEQQTRSWDDKTSGEKKYRTEVLIGHLILLSSPNGNANGHSNGHASNGNNNGHNGNGSHRYGQPGNHDRGDDFVGVGATDGDLDIPF